MKSNKAFVFATVAVVVLFFAALALFTRNTEPETPQPAVAEEDLLVRPHSMTLGPATAKVTIVEFLDPECEACRAVHPLVKQLLAEYQGQVRLVIRYMPFHSSSVLAASALEEAREHGKYEQALDLLFERQPEWGSHAQPRPELISTYLQEIGIEEQLLRTDYLVPKHRWKVDLDYADGQKLGVRGTPTFFVNGVMLQELGYEPLKQAIDIALSMADRK